MPRLTDERYIQTHYRLRQIWLHNARVFAEISPMDQWALHGFFMLYRDLTSEELLRHRSAITAERPNLPNEAGRALSRFWAAAGQFSAQRVAASHAPARSTKHARRPQGDRHFTVKALVRPEIDVHRLARAFIEMAREEVRQQSDQQRDDQANGDQSRTKP